MEKRYSICKTNEGKRLLLLNDREVVYLSEIHPVRLFIIILIIVLNICVYYLNRI